MVSVDVWTGVAAPTDDITGGGAGRKWMVWSLTLATLR